MQPSKHDLQEDIYQLARLLVESHPDPFSGSGGPIAFHRQVQRILTNIPDSGLDTQQFLRLLRPLVASIQDGHTRIDLPLPSQSVVGQAQPWLEWDAVEGQLYISTVYREEDRQFLGARLRALEDSSFEEAIGCIRQLRGCDNEYHALLSLSSAFADPGLLRDLLAQDELPRTIHLTVQMPEGTLQDIAIPLHDEAPGQAIKPASALALPEMNAAQLGWGFLDSNHETAYVRVASLLHYREAFEYSHASGYKDHVAYHLDPVVSQISPDTLSGSIEDKINVVPSATDLLRELFTAMREAHSPYLLVDLRSCPGGNSLFATILEYFMYGMEAMIESDDGYQVKRYSPLYFANYQAASRAELREALHNGGYDFTEEIAWERRQQAELTDEQRKSAYHILLQYITKMPTFAKIFEAGTWEKAWTPQIVVVLTSAGTYSAGFDTAFMLLRHGAHVIGVPSAQAGNCFIDSLSYRLDHSGLEGFISHKWSRYFPNDPERGKLLRPDIELTYNYLVAQQFDPNATVKLALEHLSGK